VTGVDLHFFRYQLLARRADLVALGQGSTFAELASDALAAFKVACPPPFEQRAIAGFLDAKTARTDALIGKKRRMIDMLVERYAALGERTIGRATDRRVRLSHLLRAKICDGPHETPEFLDEGVPFLSVDNVVDGELRFEVTRKISPEAHDRYSEKCLPQRGDVIITKAAAIGRVALVDTDIEFNIWSPLAVLRPDPRQLRSRFLYHVLRTRDVQDQIQLAATSNTQQNIAMSDLAALRIPVAGLEAQQHVEQTLNRAQERLNVVRRALEKQIHLLREHRQALINAAVTGQLDVAKVPA